MRQSVLLFILALPELWQVDFLAKSEIFNSIDVVGDVVGDAACVTPLEGTGGMLPEEILKST